jgi:DNA-binding protein
MVLRLLILALGTVDGVILIGRGPLVESAVETAQAVKQRIKIKVKKILTTFYLFSLSLAMSGL